MQQDSELVQKACHGDQRAFEALLLRHQNYIARVVFTRLASVTDVEDIVQDAFIKAFSRLRSLDEPARFKFWLRRIALNVTHDWLRKQVRRREAIIPMPEDTTGATSHTALDSHHESEALQRIWDAIDELPDAQREVVVHHYLDGHSYEEISQILEIPVTTVRSRLQEARKSLRAEFTSSLAALNLSEIEAPDTLVERVMESIRHLHPLPVSNIGRFIPFIVAGAIAVGSLGVGLWVSQSSEEIAPEPQAQVVFADDFDDGDVSDWMLSYYSGETDLDGKEQDVAPVLAGPDLPDAIPAEPQPVRTSLFASTAHAETLSGSSLQFIKAFQVGRSAVVSSPPLGRLGGRFQVDLDVVPDEFSHLLLLGEAAPFETYDEHQVGNLGIAFGDGVLSLRTRSTPYIGYYQPYEVYHVTFVVDVPRGRFDVSVVGPVRDRDGVALSPERLMFRDLEFEWPLVTGAIDRLNLYTGSPVPPPVILELDNVVVRLRD